LAFMAFILGCSFGFGGSTVFWFVAIRIKF
jgi:hypothetical protein